MNYNDFAFLLCEVISGELPKDICVKTKDVLKNNGSIRTGIVFMEKDINASPTIYLEYHYDLFQRGIDITEIAQDIISQFYKNRLSAGVDVEFFSFFEKVSSNLYCKLINKEMNEEFLKEVPHETFLDLSLVVYCKLNDFEFGGASITIRNEHLKLWNISGDELLQIAKDNTLSKMEYRIDNISDIINGIIEDYPDSTNGDTILDYEVPMYVVSNKEKTHGSVFMIYDNIMNSICSTAGDEYFVLPSSIHEFIVVKKQADDTKEYYDDMVKSVNKDHVDIEEILADHAYLYTRNKGFLI